MTTSKQYDDLVKRKQLEIRGESVKFVPVQTLAEGATISGTSKLADGTVIKIGPQVIQPKRRGGWPKGKKRGPRKAK